MQVELSTVQIALILILVQREIKQEHRLEWRRQGMDRLNKLKKALLPYMEETQMDLVTQAQTIKGRGKN